MASKKRKRIDDNFIQQIAKDIKLKKRKDNVDDREQLFFPVQKKFKHLKVEVRYCNEQWQIDLMDMTLMER